MGIIDFNRTFNFNLQQDVTRLIVILPSPSSKGESFIFDLNRGNHPLRNPNISLKRGVFLQTFLLNEVLKRGVPDFEFQNLDISSGVDRHHHFV